MTNPSTNRPRARIDALRVAFTLAVVSLGAVANLGCTAGSTGPHPGLTRPAPARGGSGQPLPERSFYQLESSWTNDRGRSIRLASLQGRPQIVCMFFASCQFACPVLVQDMKRIEESLTAEARSRVGFVLVSFDSDHDTPAVLAEYRRRHQLGDNWTLLRGAPDDVLELAALLGVKFKRDARGQYAHSNILTLLSPGGEMVHQQNGLNSPSAEILGRINPLLQP